MDFLRWRKKQGKTHLKIGNAATLTDKLLIANYSLLIDRGYTSHEHFTEVGIIHMNGRLYDPLLRRFLNADENIQDPTNTQNYNKYGYVLNNPLMYNDPSGEFAFAFVLAWGVKVFWAKVITGAIIGAAIGVASYSLGAAFSGNWAWGSFLKSMAFGSISGAVTAGIGNAFTTAASNYEVATAFAETALGVLTKAGIHAVAQGTLSLMQGNNFGQALLSAGLASVAAGAWGGMMKDMKLDQFAQSIVGMVAFGALSGGVGSAMAGGNFWQGALIGGVVAGLNDAMHKLAPPNEYLLNQDGSTTQIGVKGGDTTDYLYTSESTGSPKLTLLATTDVQNGIATASEGGGLRDFGVNIKLDSRLQSPALYDPSFDIAAAEIGGGAAIKGIGAGVKYFNKATGGIKQWIRIGSSYSVEGGFKTYGVRWGAGGGYWKKIGNPTLQKFNKSFRQTKLPGNNWRVKDPGHFHLWKK